MQLSKKLNAKRTLSSSKKPPLVYLLAKYKRNKVVSKPSPRTSAFRLPTRTDGERFGIRNEADVRFGRHPKNTTVSHKRAFFIHLQTR